MAAVHGGESVSILDPETMQEVVGRTTEAVKDQMIEGFKAMLGPDGEAFGALPVSGGEFIAFYLDLQSRIVPLPDGSFGELRILEHLQVIAPKYAEKLDRQFDSEMAKINERST